MQTIELFTILYMCEQLVSKPTHVDDGGFDLVLTDVPDAFEAFVLALIGTSVLNFM